MYEDERRSRARGNIVFGLLLVIIGIAITSITYSSVSQSGGTYIVAYGPIIVGVIRIFKGLAG